MASPLLIAVFLLHCLMGCPLCGPVFAAAGGIVVLPDDPAG